jgi:hypothetical protein
MAFTPILFKKSEYQIPKKLKQTKKSYRSVPVPGGSNDFFAAARIYWQFIAYHQFMRCRRLRILVLNHVIKCIA